MNSLRRTALVWMTVLLAAMGAIAFGIAYEVARQETNGFLDSQLRQIALNVGDGLPDAAGPSVKHDPEDDFVIAVWTGNGAPVRRRPGTVDVPRQQQQGFSIVQASGEDWRVYQASDGGRLVQVAQRMSVRREMAEAAAIQAGLPVLIVIPLAWVLIGWSLGRLLGRVTRLAQMVEAHGPQSRAHFPVADVPTEIRPLVSAMNALTERLQQALEQQKRFVADAAHELRTPLAAMQLQLDNLRAQTPGHNGELVSELGAGIRRATNVVQQLLRLARSNEDAPHAPPESVDLTGMVTQCVADFVPAAEARGIDLGMAAVDAATLSGWPDDLKTLFGNVIDNAVRHTPRGGTVDVSVRDTGGSFVVEVVDMGCGVVEADISRLSDRFFRAAANDTEGSGLGLAIAAAVAKRHGLSLKFENRGDRSGLRVSVTPAKASSV